MIVLGLVPARIGSRRIARKNLQRVGGITLVRRALDTALACRALDVVALSSEDPEILAEAAGLPEVVAIERPAALASDDASSHSVVVHALERAEVVTGTRFDAVTLVQCTSPFTAPEDVAATVALLEASKAGSALTVSEGPSPRHLMRLDDARLRPLWEGGEEGPGPQDVWIRNGCVYASTRATIAAGRLISDDVVGNAMPRERSLDINDPLDLAFARFMAGDPGAGTSD